MNWKKIVKALLWPHPALAALGLPGALMLMLWSLVRFGSEAPLTIAVYALSFYALVIACLRVPEVIRRMQRFRRENPYYLRWQGDLQLRMNVALYGACGFNAVYAIFQLCLGLRHRSAWFYAMAGYYLLLAVMRLTLVRHTRRHAPGEDAALEWRKYRFCGALLLVMNLALAVFTLYFVYRIRVFRHHEITTIAMAAYTFTALTVAIVNVLRSHRFVSPALWAAREISLVSAAVSLLTLENALLTAYGEESIELFRQIILGATGVAVILVVQGIALHMIITARKNSKQ